MMHLEQKYVFVKFIAYFCLLNSFGEAIEIITTIGIVVCNSDKVVLKYLMC